MPKNNWVNSVARVMEQAQRKTEGMKKEFEYQVEKTQEAFSDYSVEELKTVVKDESRSNIDRNAAYRQYLQQKKEKPQTENQYKVVLMQGPANPKENIQTKTQYEQKSVKPPKTKKQSSKTSKNKEAQPLTEADIFDIVDDIWDTPEIESDYRKVALFFTDTNHGWIKCPKCGRNFRASDMDADHIYPKSKGGDNNQYNLQMLCQHCNRSKQDDTSDTEQDLSRRREELDNLKQEDYEFAKIIAKMIEDGEI